MDIKWRLLTDGLSKDFVFLRVSRTGLALPSSIKVPLPPKPLLTSTGITIEGLRVLRANGVVDSIPNMVFWTLSAGVTFPEMTSRAGRALSRLFTGDHVDCSLRANKGEIIAHVVFRTWLTSAAVFSETASIHLKIRRI